MAKPTAAPARKALTTTLDQNEKLRAEVMARLIKACEGKPIALIHNIIQMLEMEME